MSTTKINPNELSFCEFLEPHKIKTQYYTWNQYYNSG